jgi:D-glycero-D-manno-heptose 1,7-bisphosphate phosphatase
MSGRAAVFLDRDGTLNAGYVRGRKTYPPANLDEFVLLPGVAQAVADLRAAGYLTVVVTNQPDIATGKQTRAMVDALNARLVAQTGVDEVRVCAHVDADGCACRKPEPGMLLDAARDLGIDLSRSFMVGDRWRDVAAGRAAGCKTFLIEMDYDEQRVEPDWPVASLAQAVDIILGRVAVSTGQGAIACAR